MPSSSFLCLHQNITWLSMKINMPPLACGLRNLGSNGETSHEKKGDHYGSQAVRLSCTCNPYLGYQGPRPWGCSPLFRRCKLCSDHGHDSSFTSNRSDCDGRDLRASRSVV